MDFRDVVEQRRSIRVFYPKPVEIEKVGQLVTIADHAPSVGDLHPWRFIVVTKPRVIQDVADSCPYERWLYQAPLLIVICSMQEKAEVYYPGKGKLWASQSCAAAAENILLAAVDMGLGGCWVSSFESAKLRGALHVPMGVEPEIIIALGYPDEVPGRKSTVPFDSFVYFNDWNQNNVDWALVKKDIGLYFRSRYDDVKTRAEYETAERGGVRRGIDELQDKLKGMFSKVKKDKQGQPQQRTEHVEYHEHPHMEAKQPASHVPEPEHSHTQGNLEHEPRAHHHTRHYYDFEREQDHFDDSGPHSDHHGYGTDIHHGEGKDEGVPPETLHPRDKRAKPHDPDYNDRPTSPTHGQYWRDDESGQH